MGRLDLAALPNPPADAVLGAEGLIDECLLVQGLLEGFFRRALFHLPLHQSQSRVDILHVRLLVQQSAHVFDRCTQQNFLVKVVNRGTRDENVLVKFLE